MFNQIFGRFLLEQKLLTSEQLEAIQSAQKKTRVRLGLIAVSEELLTQEQADKIKPGGPEDPARLILCRWKAPGFLPTAEHPYNSHAEACKTARLVILCRVR